MESQVKKRHRRTKAELLQDPVYCAKHGIKYVKGEVKNPILTPEKKQKVKEEAKKAEEPKKRHRRTKAELMQDPEYCRKHGILPPCSVEPKPVEKKRRGKAATSVPDIEDKYLRQIGTVFERVVGLISDLEGELCQVLRATQKTLPSKCREFQDLDVAAGRFNDALSVFEKDIDKRRSMS